MRKEIINLMMVLSMLVGSLFLVLVEDVTFGRFLTYMGLIFVIGLPFIFYKTYRYVSRTI